jgi:hypothetical protein
MAKVDKKENIPAEKEAQPKEQEKKVEAKAPVKAEPKSILLLNRSRRSFYIKAKDLISSSIPVKLDSSKHGMAVIPSEATVNVTAGCGKTLARLYKKDFLNLTEQVKNQK